jgi:ectoine hydroxylase-related dioxygenase (phytanoyl-CoA dioxygenase family)
MRARAADAATDEVIDAYWRDGAVVLHGVFEPQLVAQLTAGIEAVRARPDGECHWYVGGPGQDRVFFNATRMWPRVAAFRRFVRESGVAALAGRIARSRRLNLLWDGVFYRTEGVEQPTPWHQDAPYWPVEGERIVSVWIPVDAVSGESVLGFVRGSHRMGRFQRRSFRDGGRSAHFEAGDSADARPLPDIDAGVPGFEVVREAMQPGDCLVFHGLTLHGSPGNRARASRLRVVSFRFAGDGTTFVHRPEGTSPSFPAAVQRAGEPVGGEMFPEVWRSGE